VRVEGLEDWEDRCGLADQLTFAVLALCTVKALADTTRVAIVQHPRGLAMLSWV